MLIVGLLLLSMREILCWIRLERQTALMMNNNIEKHKQEQTCMIRQLATPWKKGEGVFLLLERDLQSLRDLQDYS